MDDFGSFQARTISLSKFRWNVLQAATYSLYLAMLNMLDFTQYDVINRPALYVNHFVYATLLGVLLLNVLIAGKHKERIRILYSAHPGLKVSWLT